jgi:purine-nucleoside phosphorylase
MKVLNLTKLLMIMWDKVQETVQFIKAKNDFNPEYGVILGSGLGSFTDDMDIAFVYL